MPAITNSENPEPTHNGTATRRLFDLIYQDLHRTAIAQLRGERPDISFTPTVLIHEAYLKLGEDFQGNDPAHLYRAAAIAMRRILIDAARRRNSLKRGGDLSRSQVDLCSLAVDDQGFNPEEIDEALRMLESSHPGAAEVVQLRYFAGKSWSEIAEILRISESQAVSLWQYARAKLKCLLGDK